MLQKRCFMCSTGRLDTYQLARENPTGLQRYHYSKTFSLSRTWTAFGLPTLSITSTGVDLLAAFKFCEVN
jgi:hypothetical protein